MITVENLSKTYGAFTAVNELNLTVAQGEMFGFLGPNGAGKTTTIRLLLGFLRPSHGRVFLLGKDMSNPSQARLARQRLGYVPDVAGLDLASTGAELLHELAQLQTAPPVDQAHLITALDLNLGDLHRPLGRLSRGTRQKINIIQGLQHRPDLLILDEPTEGLDPLTKRALFGLLQGAHGRGATIFFSSHVLSEVETLCDRVAFIRHGQLISVENIRTLQRQRQRRVSLQFAPTGASEAEMHHRLLTLSGVRDLHHTAGAWHFHTDDLPSLLSWLTHWPIEDITIQPLTLEDIFLQLYEQR
jgi:ABC-2 type transport system ATP-binding protein